MTAGEGDRLCKSGAPLFGFADLADFARDNRAEVATSATLPQFGFGNNHYNWKKQLEEVRGLTSPRFSEIGRGQVGPRTIKVVSVVVVVSTA